MNTLQYAELFLSESREHVVAVNEALLTLERHIDAPIGAGTAGRDTSGGSNADDDSNASDARAVEAESAVGAIFRAVHTIKGMGATMGYAIVAELAHELETVLDRIRAGDLAIDGDVIDLLFRAADVLEQAVEASVAGREGDVTATDLVEALRALGALAPRVDGWTARAPAAPGLLVRVRLAPDTPLRGVRAFIIIQSLAKLGEVTATAPDVANLHSEEFDFDFALRLLTPSTAAEVERAIRSAGDVAEVQVGDDPASGHATRPSMATRMLDLPAETRGDGRGDGRTEVRRSRHVRIDVRRLDTLMNLVGELVVARGRLSQLASAIGDGELAMTVDQSSRLIMELRNEITASRMVPVSQVFDRYPRLVRDAARAIGKQVEFVIEGKGIELDRSMLDDIGDAIVHLLRNAIDHGLETPEERVAAGESPLGRLVLSAARDRSAVVIKVSDDGRGIDRDRVLARAKRDGLVDAAKQELSEDELLRLLARPGFSTADRVTDLSGRGVGVDAVYTRVRALGGAMDIRSVPSQGTTMLLRLPLTLAIVRALLARVADEVYAIPLAHISETLELTDGLRHTVKGREVLVARDEVLPLLRLRELVSLPPREADRELEQVVVVDVGDRRAALVVDELTGQEEIVVKQFDGVRGATTLFGGATLLGDGRPTLIVDVSGLF